MTMVTKHKHDYKFIVTGPISRGHLDHKTIEQLQRRECNVQLCK